MVGFISLVVFISVITYFGLKNEESEKAIIEMKSVDESKKICNKAEEEIVREK